MTSSSLIIKKECYKTYSHAFCSPSRQKRNTYLKTFEKPPQNNITCCWLCSRNHKRRSKQICRPDSLLVLKICELQKAYSLVLLTSGVDFSPCNYHTYIFSYYMASHVLAYSDTKRKPVVP